MSDVPPELIPNIFSHLPVNSLLRFRSLSKPICALIDSVEFIDLHLDQSLKSNSVVLKYLRPDSNTDVKILDLEYEALWYGDYNLPRGYITDYDIQVVGSCNGLLCLASVLNVVLWNPSTREHKRLPVSEIGHFDESDVLQNLVYGFCYDRLNNDYKVLQVAQDMMADPPYRRQAKVYSLTSDTWRPLKDLPSEYYFKKNIHGVLVNDALHWALLPDFCRPDFPDDRSIVSSNVGESVIISFDLVTEKFKLVPQPNYSEKILSTNVGELERKLCVHSKPYGSSNIDIWVMSSYGVEDSWTKLYSVAESVNTLTCRYLDAFAYSDSGGQVLLRQEGGNFLWYDFEQNVKDIRSPGIPMAFNTINCIRSLVKLRAGAKTDVEWELPRTKIKKTAVKWTDDDSMESFWRDSNKRGKF